MPQLESGQPALLVLWVVVIVAAAWDLWQRRIPNPLIVAGLCLGLGFQVQAHGVDGIGLALAGAAVGLVTLILPFFFRIMGGGDVKLAMVCGAFTGPELALQIVLIGTVIHGIISLLWLIARRTARLTGRDIPDTAKVPHAVGFAIATVITSAGLYTIW